MEPVPLVLDADDGIDEVGRELLVGDDDSVLLLVPLGEHRTVRGVDDGGQAEVAELARLWDVMAG